MRSLQDLRTCPFSLPISSVLVVLSPKSRIQTSRGDRCTFKSQYYNLEVFHSNLNHVQQNKPTKHVVCRPLCLGSKRAVVVEASLTESVKTATYASSLLCHAGRLLRWF